MPLQIIKSPAGTVRAFFDANAVGFQRPGAIWFKNGVLSPGAYIDNRKLQSHVSQWERVLGPLIEQARALRHSYDVVGSVETGGVSHGIAIARNLQLPHVSIRKQEKGHGLSGLVNGDASVLNGARVLEVEDMSSTLGSALAAQKAIEAAGGKVSHILLLNTWNLPDFRVNAEKHSVYALCTGQMFLNSAVANQEIDSEHADIVRYWLEHPEDQTWTYSGGWVVPQRNAA